LALGNVTMLTLQIVCC